MMMKKAWNNPKFIFTALQVCSVIAMLPALISMELAVKGALHGQLGVVAAWGTVSALWITMWTSFLLMCGRLKKEPSAFTERNARTLLVIAVCCVLLGLPSLGWIVVAAMGSGDMGWFDSSVVMQGFDIVVFFGVAAVALVLRKLLRSAMALQQDSDLTI